jgi:MoxR-like ATPase
MKVNKDFVERFEKSLLKEEEEEIKIVLKGQYKKAYDILQDAENAGLTPILVGPPGVGKTILIRYYAQEKKRPFNWQTFDESTKPAHFLGSFDPAITIREGFNINSFAPGPLTLSMLYGGYYLANEINRATEYTQNSFLEPLEERTLYIPRLGRIKAEDGFMFIAAMNPAELAGTHRISEALKDRIKVWIDLKYPNKETELDIIRVNCPNWEIPEDALDKIYDIIKQTRNHPDIENPASIRTGIALTRLYSEQIKREDPSDKLLNHICKYVIPGSIKTRPGVQIQKVVSSILSSTLGFS